MHPRLAAVYMTALADQLAFERALCPITDEVSDHIAVGGRSMDRVADALLPNFTSDSIPATRSQDVESIAACLAIESVLPADLSGLSVEKILEFRTRYPEARGEFQKYMAGFVSMRTWLADASSPQIIEERLRDEYAKTLTPQLKTLREKLRDVNIEAITGVISAKVEMPGIALGAATALSVAALNPVAGAVAGVALALLTVLRNRSTALRATESDPLAFLLSVERDLTPTRVAKRTAQMGRRPG
jgi:hypothetical protein